MSLTQVLVKILNGRTFKIRIALEGRVGVRPVTEREGRGRRETCAAASNSALERVFFVVVKIGTVEDISRA
jgi:hypothetical protein